MKKINIGIIAPSSVIPKAEFELGLSELKKIGFSVKVHPSTYENYFFYPAPDLDRAKAFFEYATDPSLDILWCARGGYGATHLLPFLKKMSSRKKPKPKTLIGYSDATALLEFAKNEWGWDTIHAPMPSLRTFSILKKAEKETLLNFISVACKIEKKAESQFKLQFIHRPSNFHSLEAPVVGGNLFVWNSLLGTPYQGNASGKILFLEEIQENLGRINRMVHHLEQAGGLKKVKAIVLGDFLDCNDSVGNSLDSIPDNVSEDFLRNPPSQLLKPMRTLYSSEVGLNFIFKELGVRNQIPILKGAPVGHGPNYFPLFFGKKYSILKNGKFYIS